MLGNGYRQALQHLPLHFAQRWTVWIKIHLLCHCRSLVGRRQPLMQWKCHSTFCHEILSPHFHLPYSVLASDEQQPHPQLPDHTLVANVRAMPFSSSPSAHKDQYHCSLFYTHLSLCHFRINCGAAICRLLQNDRECSKDFCDVVIPKKQECKK